MMTPPYRFLKTATFCSLLHGTRSFPSSYSSGTISQLKFHQNAGAIGMLSFTSSMVGFGKAIPSPSSRKETATSLYSVSPESMTLPVDYPNIDKIRPALSAIRKACRVTTHLQPDSSSDEIRGITKKDSSPVTIGDFAAQAIILNILDDAFDGNHMFIAEEESSNLSSGDGASDLSDEILDVLEKCGLKGFISSTEELRRSIDLGQTYKMDGKLIDSIAKQDNQTEGNMGRMRWCLDPIDGTRGFLRGKREGGQYCVALALIRNGVPIVGILGCPNLPVLSNDNNYEWSEGETAKKNLSTRGCIFVASKGGGCWQLPLYPLNNDDDDSVVGAKRIHVTQNDGKGEVSISDARFCIGVEKYGDPEGKVSAIAKKIHGKLGNDGEIMHTRRMDSQVKYGVVARGGAEIITRLPKKSYVEWIWDHAAGRVIIEEAGGCQTDTNGHLVDYGLGAKMDHNVDGLLISCGGKFHEALLDAYQKQEEVSIK